MGSSGGFGKMKRDLKKAEAALKGLIAGQVSPREVQRIE
jgi:hypothetical protein